jgi:hypothetical protein
MNPLYSSRIPGPSSINLRSRLPRSHIMCGSIPSTWISFGSAPIGYQRRRLHIRVSHSTHRHNSVSVYASWSNVAHLHRKRFQDSLHASDNFRSIFIRAVSFISTTVRLLPKTKSPRRFSKIFLKFVAVNCVANVCGDHEGHSPWGSLDPHEGLIR